jgi:hypothetical protein
LSSRNTIEKIIEGIKHSLILFMVAVTLASFAIGIFLVFFTNLGGDISWSQNVSLDFLLINIFGFQSPQFNLGITFLFFLSVYLICYLYCLIYPHSILRQNIFRKWNLIRTKRLQEQKSVRPEQNSNLLIIAISWFSGYFLLSVIIDTIQQLFGVTLGNPLTENALLSFFYLSAAPLNEEILFRVLLLGVPLLLIFSPIKKGNFVLFLNHPYKFLAPNKTRYTIMCISIVIVINSVIFGMSHVFFGGGYEVGKITQAALGGLVLAWIYYRYGLATAIVFHWISNFVFFAYSILGFYLFGTPWNTETDSIFLSAISIGFIIIGILFLYQLTTKILKKYVVN